MNEADGYRSLLQRSLTYALILALIIAAIVLAIVMLGKAHAQAPGPGLPACAPHGEMLGKILSGYKETVIEQGVAYNPQGKLVGLMEMTGNPDEQTWTLLLINPADGETCVLLSGDHLGGRRKPEKGA